ncbi:hypothetical protein ACFE04_021100 [Oxalis oulophora]
MAKSTDVVPTSKVVVNKVTDKVTTGIDVTFCADDGLMFKVEPSLVGGIKSMLVGDCSKSTPEKEEWTVVENRKNVTRTKMGNKNKNFISNTNGGGSSIRKNLQKDSIVDNVRMQVDSRDNVCDIGASNDSEQV